MLLKWEVLLLVWEVLLLDFVAELGIVVLGICCWFGKCCSWNLLLKWEVLLLDFVAELGIVVAFGWSFVTFWSNFKI